MNDDQIYQTIPKWEVPARNFIANHQEGHYWVVRDNDLDFFFGKIDYSGKPITTELLNDIKYMDACRPVGYSKFVLWEVIDGKVINDEELFVGDGLNLNQNIYDNLNKHIFHFSTEDYNESELDPSNEPSRDLKK
jgi:hypothetical protein